MNEQLRRVPLHRSLTRPILLAGAERSLTILNSTFVVMLIFGCGIHVITLVTALFFGTIIQALLAKAAKVDPYLSLVYQRHLHYQRFYSAQASIHAKTVFIKPTMVFS